jgi:deoxyribose-phosphate aldolase
MGGANEIDVVFPYKDYLNGNTDKAFSYIAECQKICGTAALKVIIETSEFSQIETIYDVAKALIQLGVAFLKTSTGKTAQGATLETACTMLLAIKDSRTQTGFKASGGIKTVLQAYAYIDLARSILGEDWVSPEHFRIGASSLLDDIVSHLRSVRPPLRSS